MSHGWSGISLVVVDNPKSPKRAEVTFYDNPNKARFVAQAIRSQSNKLLVDCEIIQ